MKYATLLTSVKAVCFVLDIICYLLSIKIIFQEKIRLDIPCELAVKQMIHMKCQALY